MMQLNAVGQLLRKLHQFNMGSNQATPTYILKSGKYTFRK